jgi:hypothetical protein
MSASNFTTSPTAYAMYKRSRGVAAAIAPLLLAERTTVAMLNFSAANRVVDNGSCIPLSNPPEVLYAVYVLLLIFTASLLTPTVQLAQ